MEKNSAFCKLLADGLKYVTNHADMKTQVLIVAFLTIGCSYVRAQQQSTTGQKSGSGPRGNPADTEVWEPVPAVVVPAAAYGAPPSDAIILFDGTNLEQWVSTKDKSAANWKVESGVLTVNKADRGNNIETKKSFKDYQLHIEWRIPANISGEGQARGNSGLFLASTGGGDAGYEVQIVDTYNNENKAYVNGSAGSIYKQFAPLSNPARKPGEWNTYDIAWLAPTFNDDGSVKTPAKVTVLFNNVLVQNNVDLLGETVFIGKPVYKKYETAPIKLQAHGDPSEPISFRNIWIRDLSK
jgi:hypothetical protein